MAERKARPKGRKLSDLTTADFDAEKDLRFVTIWYSDKTGELSVEWEEQFNALEIRTLLVDAQAIVEEEVCPDVEDG